MNDNIAEKLETNNALASSSQVCIAQPNLRIVSVSNPSSALLGQTVDVTVIVENIGASNSMAFSVELKLSVESPSGHSDILLDTFQVNSLNSQTNSQFVRTVQLPGSPAGTYHLYAIADSSGVITESDETDNQKSSSSFNINAPTTDLLALAISGPSGAEPEQTVEISWGVRNLGADPLSFEIEIWLSVDKRLDGSDKIIRSQSLNSLE
jgi:subtilase family serine protease